MFLSPPTSLFWRKTEESAECLNAADLTNSLRHALDQIPAVLVRSQSYATYNHSFP